MSLINFLNQKFKPSVECNAVTEDEYSAENLISDSFQEQARGFMAFSVTKPPVDLILSFPIAIQVRKLKIWNTLGSLKTTGIEISAKTGENYEKIGLARDITGESVMFCFPREQNSISTTESSIERSLFFKSAARILAETNSIKITIKTTQKCPAVLRKIEVWGLPAKSVSKAKQKEILAIWNSILNPQDDTLEKFRLSPQANKPTIPDDFETPEEYLDAITYEIMIFPTVLPSGKVVDQSTIEKHSANEAKWGRLPSDPFTGLIFTSRRKPILDLALKLQIESFMIQNSEHFKTLPRTLGTIKCKRKYPTDVLPLYKDHSKPQESYVKKQKVDRKINYLPATDLTTTSLSSSDLTYNVERAIQVALQKITRFTQPQIDVKKLKRTSCIVCKNVESLYKILTCNHLVCRSCLKNLTKQKFCYCSISFTSIDIVKYHHNSNY